MIAIIFAILNAHVLSDDRPLRSTPHVRSIEATEEWRTGTLVPSSAVWAPLTY
jgi:hypothetical protein